MACADRTLKLMREYAALRAEVTQDTTMTGELCSLIATHSFGHADGENHVRELIETARRAPRRETRRKRIFFIHTLPNWQDSMIRMLETENRCELVGCDLTFDSLTALDPEKPFESMARRLLANVNGGSAARIDNAIAWAKKLNADGVILFATGAASRRWGCPRSPSAGWRKPVCRRWCSTATAATAETSRTDRWSRASARFWNNWRGWTHDRV